MADGVGEKNILTEKLKTIKNFEALAKNSARNAPRLYGVLIVQGVKGPSGWGLWENKSRNSRR